MNTLAIGCLSGLLACVGSFVWAMSGGFFRTVERIPPKVRLIQVVGAVALIANVIALVAPPPVGVGWGLTAILMYGAALALFWWAIRTNWRRPLTHAFTPDQPGHLTQDGPYRWIRHPFYSSYLIAWLAGAVATSKVWLLVPFAASQ